MKKMNVKLLFCGALLGSALMTGAVVHADEIPASAIESAVDPTEEAVPVVYETPDGVLSIEVPGVDWQIVEDPKYWFALSDGDDLITFSHLSNGEALPAVEVANENYEAIYQAFVSTQNEVFMVKGSAAKKDDLQGIMEAIRTVQILKFDTKTALQKETAPVSAFGLRQINDIYYVTANDLNVRTGCSTDNSVIAVLGRGDQVKVLGAVTKDGKDFGWYQIDMKGTTAYVSANYLSKTKPEQKKEEPKKEESKKGESKQEEPKKEEPKKEEPARDWFTVYAEDGSHVNIALSADGTLYEDADGHKYTNVRGDLYVNMDTDVQYNADINYWVDGEPQPDPETASEEEQNAVIETAQADAGEEQIVEEPKVEEPVVDEPVVEEPKVEEPVVEEPKVEEPVVEEPVVEEPVVEEPKVEEPAPQKKEVKVVGEDGESFTITENSDGTFSDEKGEKYEAKGNGIFVRISDQTEFSRKD